MADVCRLCQKTAELKKSHVLSDFLYRPAYDAIHRAVEMKTQSGRRRFIQKGYYERMLCGDCEGRFNVWETYFADEWYNKYKLPDKLTEAVVPIAGLDYTAFKLFHLSVIWRAGVSARDEFRNVKLGPHEEKLRDHLLRGDPGPPELYPFWGRILFDPQDRTVRDDVIVEPVLSRVDGHFIYIFTFGGCSWCYFVSSHDPGNLVPTRFEPGKDLRLVAQDLYRFPPIAEFVQSYTAAKGV
jgi:hypothetical protein